MNTPKTYTAWKKKREQAAKNGQLPSFTDFQIRNYGEQVMKNLSDRINAFYENSSQFYKDNAGRYSGRTNTYEDAYVSDSSDWLDSTNARYKELEDERAAIKAELKKYQDYIDFDTLNKTVRNMYSVSRNNSKIADLAKADNNYWSQWADEDAYNQQARYLALANSGQASEGWKKYLADQSTNATPQTPAWQEAILRGFSTSNDNPIVMAINNAKYDYENSDNRNTKPNDNWSQEQKNIFGALYLQDPEEAKRFAVSINSEEGWFKSGNDNFWAALGASFVDLVQDVGAGFVGAGEKILDGIATVAPYIAQGQYYQNGGGYNIQADQIFEQSNQAAKEWSKEFVKKDLYDEAEITNKFLAGFGALKDLSNIEESYNDSFIYLAGDEEAGIPSQLEKDSVFGAKTDGLIQSAGQLLGTRALQGFGVPWWITTAATSIGGESEDALLNHDATLEEAALSGIISAGAEILTENIAGIHFQGKTLNDALTKKLSTAISDRFTRTLIGFGVDVVGEGGEELISEVINDFGRWLTYENDEELLEILFSEESLQAKLDAFIGGAVLGSVGGLGSIKKRISENNAASKLYNGKLGKTYTFNGKEYQTNQTKDDIKALQKNLHQDLVSESLGIDPTSEFAQDMQAKLDKGKKLSGGQINQLIENNNAIMREQDVATVQKAAAERLTQLGETGNVEAISKALTKQLNGETLTRAEKQTISNSKYGQRVVNELNPDNIKSGKYTSAWAEKIGTDSINAAEYNRQSTPDTDAAANSPSLASEAAAQQTGGSPATENVSANESAPGAISEASEPKTLEEASKKYGAQAKAMIHTYKEGQDIVKYDRAYSIAYDIGKAGGSLDYVMNKSPLTSYLTMAQRELAYEAGKAAGDNNANTKSSGKVLKKDTESDIISNNTDGGIANGTEQEWQTGSDRRAESGITASQSQTGKENENRSRVQDNDRRTQQKIGEASGTSNRGFLGIIDNNNDIPFNTRDIVHITKESVLYVPQQKLINEYGIECHIIKDSIWEKLGPNAHAGAYKGKVYMHESFSGELADTVVPHESTHIMKQLKYKPYIDFVDKTSTLIDFSHDHTEYLFAWIEDHLGIDYISMTESEANLFYDEINAAIYGFYKTELFEKYGYSEWMPNAFYDFDSYISELDAIHEQFKKEHGAKANIQIITKEAKKNGEDSIRIRDGSERNRGQDSRRQISTVESDSGQNESRRGDLKPRDREAASLTYGEEVSAKSLGIKGGLDSGKVKLIARGSETVAMRTAKQRAEKRGLKVTFFAGDNLYIEQKGEVISARSYIIGDEVYIRVDHPYYTADQLMRHEIGHDMIDKGEVDINEVRERIKARFDDVDFVIEQYTKAYAGSKMTADEIFEEIICDSLGDMNAFASVEVLGKINSEFLSMLKEETKASVKEARGPPKENAGKASREYWYPKLTQKEWNLLTRRMNKALSSPDNYIDNITKWLYAEEKGVRIFAIYGIGDGTEATVLYATGGRSADTLISWREKYESGVDQTKRNPYRKHLDRIRLEQNKYGNGADGDGENNLGRNSGSAKEKTVSAGQISSGSQWGDNGETVYGDSEQKIISKASRELEFIDFLNENAAGTTVEEKPLSNREILANALESTAKHEVEIAKLAEYKKNISKLDAEQAKLQEIRAKIRELSFATGPRDQAAINKLRIEANTIANRINAYDSKLLGLESTTALKNVLLRAKKQAADKAKAEARDALSTQKEKAKAALDAQAKKYQDARKKATESRHKTEMRHKIKKVVGELNSLLLNPTKEKHIKEELRAEVANALSAINMDTVDADARVARYDELIAKETNPDIIAELTETRDNIQRQGDNLKEKLAALQSAYEKIKDTNDMELKNSYQEAILNSIKATSEKIGDTSLRNMSMEQLESVYDLVTMIRHTIRDANKAFKAKKGETIAQMADAVNDQVRAIGGQPYKRAAVVVGIQKTGWTFLKPYVAFRTIGSTTLTDRYLALREGEDTFYNDVEEAQAFIKEQYQKHNYKSWDMKKTFSFTAKSGKTFDLTLEQMMTLYAYSRREQAHKHVTEGGLVFEDAMTVEKTKLGVPIKYEITTKDAFNLSEETFAEIVNSLSTEQKAFVDEMQHYLSVVMGAKGNEVSMELLGVKLFKEEFYLPIKSSQYYMNFSAEEAGEIKLKSPAFSKETVKHANNPIVLHNFTDLWAEHVNDMAMYHSFVLALEDFTRVYNYKTKTDADVETMDIKATLETAYPGVTKYINKFLKDMNGGIRSETVGWAEKLTSLSKKGAVLGSASVAIQQPSAIMRAMAIINPKYFVTTAHKSIDLRKHKQDWAELKKYAPIAGIKEMGRFDVGMGASTKDFILTEDHESAWQLLRRLDIKGLAINAKDFLVDSNYRDEVLSKAPAFMDEVTWVTIWHAVKRETLHNHSDLAPTSEEFLKLAGERFTEVVSLSQVYDSVFSRSDLMRNKSWIAKATTAFMAEPTTTMNMLWDAYIQGKRTGSTKEFIKTTAKTGGAVVASIILNAALKSIIMAMRDDDEDESYAEKYLESFVGDLKDNLNPLSLVPVAKDIISIFNGYDVTRMDMSLISDFKNAIDAFNSDNKTAYEKWAGLTGAIAAFFGVPIKNVERDIRAAINTFFGEKVETTKSGLIDAITEGWTGEEGSKTQRLYNAIMSGDEAQINRIESQYKSKSAFESAMRQALRENDNRIKKAAGALISGDISGFSDYLDDITSEGNFDEEIIEGAIRAEKSAFKTKIKKAAEAKNLGDDEEYKKIVRELRESYRGIFSQDDIIDFIKDAQNELNNKKEDADEVTSIYQTSDVNAAFNYGDSDMALEIIDTIIKTKVANGKTEKEATSAIRSSMTSYWKPLYKEACKNRDTAEKNRIKKILVASGMYGKASSVDTVLEAWAAEKDK